MIGGGTNHHLRGISSSYLIRSFFPTYFFKFPLFMLACSIYLWFVWSIIAIYHIHHTQLANSYAGFHKLIPLNLPFRRKKMVSLIYFCHNLRHFETVWYYTCILVSQYIRMNWSQFVHCSHCSVHYITALSHLYYILDFKTTCQENSNQFHPGKFICKLSFPHCHLWIFESKISFSMEIVNWSSLEPWCSFQFFNTLLPAKSL